MSKKSAKFLVSSTYKFIDFELTNGFKPEGINVKWSRKFRFTDSKKSGNSPTWNPTRGNSKNLTGRATFHEACKPSLEVTLRKNKKGEFEKKLYKYSLESIGYDQKVKTIASAEIDLSEYADLSGSEHHIAILLEPKKKYVLKAIIHLSLSFEFIRSGSSKDDDMISTWSRESLDLDAFKPDDLDDSGEVMDFSVNSLVHKMKELSSDVVVGTPNFFENLTNCQLIVIICNAEFTHLSPELIATTNNFYSKVKAKFGDTVELFYLSFDKDEEAFTTALNTHKLRCPAIKPFSKLHSTLSQSYDITKVPYLIVLSQDKLVGCASDIQSISVNLEPKTAENRVKKWIESVPERNAINERNRELENKISSLRERNLRYKSTIGHLSQKKREWFERISILKAERNIKGILLKKGVVGLTKSVWRPRQFQHQNGKIIYIDPKNNQTKGEIPLSEIVYFDVLPMNRQGKYESNFNIVTMERVYEMQARDKQHMDTWIEAALTLKQIDFYETSQSI